MASAAKRSTQHTCCDYGRVLGRAALSTNQNNYNLLFANGVGRETRNNKYALIMAWCG